MYIKVIDNTNNFKSSYVSKIRVNNLEDFLNKFNFINIEDLFIFPNQYEKLIIINMEELTRYNHFKIKIVISGLTDKTFKKAQDIVFKKYFAF